MTQPSRPLRTYLRTAGEYAGAAALCVALLTCVYQLWKTDLTVPLEYCNDALLAEMFVQTVTENGWYLHNDRIGAPFGLDMHDFPVAESLHFAAIKGLAWIFDDPFVVLNLYFLLTFPLAALTALFVFRHFGCSYCPALVGSQLFAFLPYHFMRGEGHLFLSGYYLVPLAVLVVLWLMLGDHLLFVPRDGKKPRVAWRGGKTLASLAVCVLLGCAGVYYAFFACFFLLLAGVAARLGGKAVYPLRSAALLVGVIAATCLVHVTPAVLYAREHGRNDDAVRRGMADAEHFGLRISQMLMPVTGHRLPVLAWAKASFNRKLAQVTENDYASLGLAGSVGFLCLIGRLLARRGGGGLFDALSLLNLFAVLLGTLGGFGLLFASVLPHIRCYNRLSVYIAFFSLAAVVLLLDALHKKLAASPLRKSLFAAALGLLVVGGVLDQSPHYVGSNEACAAEFQRDATFVRAIETALPQGALVYQMPYRVFPEGGTYDHLRLSLHSTDLRWNYPVMRGRQADYWNREIATRPVAELLPTLAVVGFQGLTIDRLDYPDRACQLESDLEAVLHRKPLVDATGRYAFFDLTDYGARLRGRHTDAQWQALQENALHPVLPSWHRGFSMEFDVATTGGRWCGTNGELMLFNPALQTQRIKLTMALRTGCPQAAHVRISGPLLTKELTIDGQSGDLTETLTVPPGRHVLHFWCDGQPTGNDPRRIFKVTQFRIDAVGSD
jgi:phosphoglycerol transferase